ncbi:MAG TPA: protein kinase, partial [Anaerolineae bacterium]|nr:protein kinase [Anaerolineae bacterium]
MFLSPNRILKDRYRILSLLGQGGMGSVYRGFDTALDRPVAVKQLLPAMASDATTTAAIKQQFEREAKILAALTHPNLPRVTDYFTDDNMPYLVMDYVEGDTLSDLLKQKRNGFPEIQVLNWADQILSALDYIHAHGVIHRDIKPGNLRLTPDGRIFLVDFGLSKSLQSEHPETATMMRGVGTAEYAPPEQYDSTLGHTDARADIYSLGATLYHLLVGKAPATVTQRMAEPQSFQPMRDTGALISPQIDRVINRAMEIERAKRFASAADMRAALKLAAPDRSTGSISTRLLGNVTSQPKRSTGRIALIGLISVALLAAAIVIVVTSSPSTRPPSTPTATTPIQPDVRIVTLSGTSTPEYVDIKNFGGVTQTLTGWKLVSTEGQQTFNFPNGFALPPGASVRLSSYTGAINNPPT